MKNQLNPLAAGLSLGLLWGLGLFVWTLLAVKSQIGLSSLELITEWYPSYEVTVEGAFWGLLWGFLDGLIGGLLIVWVYNFFARKLSK